MKTIEDIEREGYRIDACGLVWSYKTHSYLVNHKDKDGYRYVRIGTKSYKVHRLVAMKFIPNPENKPEVNHIDFNRSNNYVPNLEWVNRKENVQHSRDNYAGTYVFLDPHGNIHRLHNLKRWCEDKPHLCRYSMAKVHRGVIKSYKGWTKYVEC